MLQSNHYFFLRGDFGSMNRNQCLLQHQCLFLNQFSSSFCYIQVLWSRLGPLLHYSISGSSISHERPFFRGSLATLSLSGPLHGGSTILGQRPTAAGTHHRPGPLSSAVGGAQRLDAGPLIGPWVLQKFPLRSVLHELPDAPTRTLISCEFTSKSAVSVFSRQASIMASRLAFSSFRQALIHVSSCNRSSDGRVHHQVPLIMYMYYYCNNVLAPHLLVTVPGQQERVYCTERSKEEGFSYR
jgi:hypothetical protein